MLRANVTILCDIIGCYNTMSIEIKRGSHHVLAIPEIIDQDLSAQGWERKYVHGYERTLGYYCPECCVSIDKQQHEKDMEDIEEEL